jgi:hypothetical protein
MAGFEVDAGMLRQGLARLAKVAGTSAGAAGWSFGAAGIVVTWGPGTFTVPAPAPGAPPEVNRNPEEEEGHAHVSAADMRRLVRALPRAGVLGVGLADGRLHLGAFSLSVDDRTSFRRARTDAAAVAEAFVARVSPHRLAAARILLAEIPRTDLPLHGFLDASPDGFGPAKRAIRLAVRAILALLGVDPGPRVADDALLATLAAEGIQAHLRGLLADALAIGLVPSRRSSDPRVLPAARFVAVEVAMASTRAVERMFLGTGFLWSAGTLDDGDALFLEAWGPLGLVWHPMAEGAFVQDARDALGVRGVRYAGADPLRAALRLRLSAAGGGERLVEEVHALLYDAVDNAWAEPTAPRVEVLRRTVADMAATP